MQTQANGGLFSPPNGTGGGLFGGTGGGIFGSSTTGGLFGTAAGGLFSTGAQNGAPTGATGEEDDEHVPEEEVTSIPGWAPSVSLEVKEVETGEEQEEEFYSQRSKLYRFRDGEWKERGLGDAKLLKHKESGEIRFMLRQEKTGKIVANHFVVDQKPYCDLKPQDAAGKTWVWAAYDCAEDTGAVEKLALKFRNEELGQAFKEAFDKAKEHNSALPKFRNMVGGGNGSAPPATPTPAAKPAAPAPPAAAPPTTEAAAPSLFATPAAIAAPPASSGGLFSSFAQAAAEAPASSGGLFSSLAAAAATGGLWGSPSTASTGGLFNSSTGAGGLFGTGGGLFGSTSQSSSAPAAATPAPAATGGLFSTSTSPATGGLFGTSNGTAGGGLFGSTTSGLFGTAASGEAPEDEDEAAPEEEVTVIPGWAASVTLEVKEVETGEENEEEIYSQRSKLYRFKEGEWKERGLGDAKLLKHKESGEIRFMLRQEKTGKIVANHFVVDHKPYCDVKAQDASGKVMVWAAHDCAEETPEVENFALKFANEELAKAFQTAFVQAKHYNSTLPRFKGLGGGNDETDSRAGSVAEQPAPAATSTSLFGAPAQPNAAANASSGGLFSTTAAAPASTGGLFGASASTGGLFSSLAATGGLFSPSTPATGGLFGAGTGGGLFSNTGGLFGSASQDSTSQPAATAGGLFGSSGGLFSGSAAPGAPQEEEDENVPEEEVTEIAGWSASITLEVKEVETGEENEEEIYSQRSKLYRFKDGEWKERGLGDAKLLKHKVSGEIRFMLRQERTGKIVANHYVVDSAPYCDLKPQDTAGKIWMWAAHDCAEDSPEVEKLALKFSSEELAKAFQVAFNGAKQHNGTLPKFQGLASGGSQGSAAPAPSSAPAPQPKAAPKAAPTFASPPASSGSLFGATAAPAAVSSTAAAPAATGGLFGPPSSTAGGLFNNTGGGLFGSTAMSAGSLFGASPAPAPAAGGLFSSLGTGGNLFGTGGSSIFSNPATGGLFSSASAGTGSAGLFSSVGSTSGAPSSGGLFSSPGTGLFATGGSAGGLWAGTGRSTGSLFPFSAAGAGANGGEEHEEEEEEGEYGPYEDGEGYYGDEHEEDYDDYDEGGDYTGQEDYHEEETVPATNFAALAAAQAAGGWQCPSCRLRWPEEAITCTVCEKPRPGMEQEAAKAQEQKETGTRQAAAAFLGTSSSSAPVSSGFGQPAPTQPVAPLNFGSFGSSAPSSGGSIFGTGSFGATSKAAPVTPPAAAPPAMPGPAPMTPPPVQAAAPAQPTIPLERFETLERKMESFQHELMKLVLALQTSVASLHANSAAASTSPLSARGPDPATFTETVRTAVAEQTRTITQGVEASSAALQRRVEERISALSDRVAALPSTRIETLERKLESFQSDLMKNVITMQSSVGNLLTTTASTPRPTPVEPSQIADSVRTALAQPFRGLEDSAASSQRKVEQRLAELTDKVGTLERGLKDRLDTVETKLDRIQHECVKSQSLPQRLAHYQAQQSRSFRALEAAGAAVPGHAGEHQVQTGGALGSRGAVEPLLRRSAGSGHA